MQHLSRPCRQNAPAAARLVIAAALTLAACQGGQGRDCEPDDTRPECVDPMRDPDIDDSDRADTDAPPDSDAPADTDAPRDTDLAQDTDLLVDPGASFGTGSLNLPLLGAFVDVAVGSFTMGCLAGRDDAPGNCGTNESPTHEVTLTADLEVMASEVTQQAWIAAFGNNPSLFPTCASTCPVDSVTWWEALAFANAASEVAGFEPCYRLLDCAGTPGIDLECDAVELRPLSGHPKDCEGYRLPTEAEWEFAARGGEAFPFAGDDDLEEVAWYDANALGTPHPVCGKAVNAFGLCDMTGNLSEWCWDGYDEHAYGTEARVDPQGPGLSERHAARGGNWNLSPNRQRIARRGSSIPSNRASGLGFRLVRSVAPVEE